MDVNKAMSLMEDLLNAEDSDGSDELDTSNVAVSIQSAESVIESIKKNYASNKVTTTYYSDTESEEDDIDGNDPNDPDYEPILNVSTDTSFIVEDQQSVASGTAVTEKDTPYSPSSTSTQQSSSTPIQPSTSTQNFTHTQPPSATHTQLPTATTSQSSLTTTSQPSSATTSQSSSATPIQLPPATPIQPPPATPTHGPSSASTQPVLVPSISKRKRANPAMWKKNLKKAKVNTGEEYQTLTGKTVPARKTGQSCKCRQKCFEKISKTQQQQILTSFNDIGKKDFQDMYLHACIQRKTPARKRPRTGTRTDQKGGKQYSYTCNIKLSPRQTISVCADAFTSLHGIGSSCFKRISKVTAPLPPPEGRGGSREHPVLTDEIKAQIKEHISSFPRRESHYSRNDNKNRQYLNENLNVKRMWLLYLETYEPNQRLLYHTDRKQMNPVVKYKFYLNVFDSEFNLTFGQPRSDTCPICDKFVIDIKAAAGNDPLIKSLEGQRDIHQQRAENGYKRLSDYSKKAKNDANLEVYTFDFEQNLPCPSVNAGDMFYSRALWTYNFGIHDCKMEDGIMHVWCEAEAGRGSSEVATCLKQTLFEKHEKYKAEHLVLFSDGCAGQNKNKAMVSFLLGLVKDKIYKSVQHFFLYRGHTFLPNDRDFSHIEKRKRVEKVLVPNDWENIIKESRMSQPFQVVNHVYFDFFDYKKHADENIKSIIKCDDGKNLRFQEVMWFSYGSSSEMDPDMIEEHERTHVNEVWCRYTHSAFEPWKKVNFLKRNKIFATEEVLRKYRSPIGIKPAKKNDLKALLKKGLIDAGQKEFYESLPIRNTHVQEEDDDYA